MMDSYRHFFFSEYDFNHHMIKIQTAVANKIRKWKNVYGKHMNNDWWSF